MNKRKLKPWQLAKASIQPKPKKSRSMARSVLPILPLSEAIKRLGDDEIWVKVSKRMRYDNED